MTLDDPAAAPCRSGISSAGMRANGSFLSRECLRSRLRPRSRAQPGTRVPRRAQLDEKRRRLDSWRPPARRSPKRPASGSANSRALFAEVERDLIGRAHPRGPCPAGQASGLEARRPKRVPGRGTACRQDGNRASSSSGASPRAPAKITGVSRTTLYSFISPRTASSRIP